MSSMPPPPPPPPPVPPPPSSPPFPPSYSPPGGSGGAGGFQPPSYPGGGAAYPPSAYPAAAPIYAGFWQRFFHMLIDAIVNGLVTLPFSIAGIVMLRKALEHCYAIDFGNRQEIHCPDGALQVGWLVGAIVAFAVGVVVGLIFYCRMVGRGQSVGMRSLNIRLVNADTGQPVGAWRAFGWQVAHIASGLPLCLGYLWAIWDPRKQTWHDKICNTVMIRDTY